MKKAPGPADDGSEGTVPFRSAFGLTERPLYLVVSWPVPQIRDADHALVQELQTHLAATLLCGEAS
jgi:hypothetical protein